MKASSFATLISDIETIKPVDRFGLVMGTGGGLVEVSGLSPYASVGDLVTVKNRMAETTAEVLSVSKSKISILPEAGTHGISIGDTVRYAGSGHIYPDISWVGRTIDAYAKPLDGKPLKPGREGRSVLANPPPAARRKRLGPMLETGLTAFNTFLPLVQGQRIGLFAGSGVGKSTLLASLAKQVEADYVVIALVGERGREVREFIEDTLGEDGLKKAVVVAATSDQSPVLRRRAAWTAMSVAEYLRDQGGHVLLLMDSITRFCEAHREIATTTGETTALRGFPPSTPQALMGLCERAGPGAAGQGDITAVFSVLVAGSDMDEPVADMVRGVLDGHVILDRSIAERGRFPAIDILRSVSRCYDAATPQEVKPAISNARTLMAAYDQAEVMIQTGLYQQGTDPMIDRSINARAKFETFLSSSEDAGHVTIDEAREQLLTLLQTVNGPAHQKAT